MLPIDFNSLFAGVHFVAPTLGVALTGLLGCLLLVASGFASGSEIAIFSLSPNDLNELDEEKSESDKKLKALRDDSERTLATILITNNLVNVTIIMLFNKFFEHTIDFGNSYWLRFTCLTVILTFLLLLFGEIMPKLYCAQRQLAFCRKTVGGILFCRKLFYPLSSILLRTGVLVEKVVKKENHVLSANDLEQALELTDKSAIKDEKNILEGIAHFGNETVKEIMTSRQDVVDINFESQFSDVIKCIVENKYSRVPVYQGTMDSIRGVLYIKDLLPHLGKPASFRWQSLIRPPYFVPETKKIDDLLKEFQQNKVHMAIVVDEFGGTSGIVTLEDILEEIVGEINDEYDDDEKNYIRVNDNTYIFEGKTLISDFCKIIATAPDTFGEVEGDADTLAGLILEIKGDFPELREKITFEKFTFEIINMDERRISKIKVTIDGQRNSNEDNSESK